MSDLRSRLERIGDRTRIAPDAFERLERARRRRDRNRRITAGTVALLVAIAGSVAAFTAFRSNDGGRAVGGGGQAEFFALWPESTYDAALAAQDSVAAGDPSRAWRLDALETAQAFVHEALGWPESPDELVVRTATTSSDGTVTADLANGVDPGTCNRPECDGREVIVRLRQLVETDGIWSVVSVESPVFNIPLHTGEDVRLGSELSIAAGWPDGTEVAVGFAGTGSCSAFQEHTEDVADMAVTTVVGGVPDGCTGYAYALTPSSEKGSVELGSLVFPCCGWNVKPDLAYTVTSITAVPVRFTAFEPGEQSDVAEFTCDETGTISPSSLTIDAQPDGVHVAVTNAADERISFTVAGSESTTYVVGDGGADPGERKEVVLEIPPGDADVSCVLGSKGGIDTSPIADLRVADPAGTYIRIGMDCPMSSQSPDHAPGAVGFRDDPAEVARQHLSGLEYDDAVERAGYPSSEQPIVRVVRNGDVVAVATFMSDGRGGWLMDSLRVCVNVLIGWSDEVIGVTGPMGSPSPPTAWDQLCSVARGGGIHNGNEVHVTGRDTRFDTRCLIVPAGEPLTILFSNGDAGVPRNLSIYELTPYLRECIVTGTAPAQHVGRPLFRGELIEGVDEVFYDVNPLAPGEYYFQDDGHPSANGVLVVE
jgi:hypothetical protein